MNRVAFRQQDFERADQRSQTLRSMFMFHDRLDYALYYIPGL